MKYLYNPARGCWSKPYSTQHDLDEEDEVVLPFRGHNKEQPMSVWFHIHVNTRPVAVVEIRRIKPRRTPTDPETIGDYVVTLDGTEIGHVQHRYCDSIHVLIATATSLIGAWAHSPDDDEQEQQPQI